MHQATQVQLTLPRQNTQISVALEEVEQLGGVGHPKGQSTSGGLLALQRKHRYRGRINRLKVNTLGFPVDLPLSCLDDLPHQGHGLVCDPGHSVRLAFDLGALLLLLLLQSGTPGGVKDVGGRQSEVNRGAASVTDEGRQDGVLSCNPEDTSQQEEAEDVEEECLHSPSSQNLI